MACPFFGEDHKDHDCMTCKHKEGNYPKDNPEHICYPCMYAYTVVPSYHQVCNWEPANGE